MSAHAVLGPSSADRYFTCTASVALIAELRASGAMPADSSSFYASEGTAAHQLREDCLNTGLDAYDFIGQNIRADGIVFPIDEDLANHIQPGVDWLREMLDEIHVEVKVRLDSWMPGQFGTSDAGGIYANTLLISDYKHGMGVPVAAVGSRQLRLYALGLWHYLKRPAVEKVLLHIDQPRAGGQKFWEITLEELLEFGKEASEVYLKIKTGDTEFSPSEKACKGCGVKDTEQGCPAYNDWMYDVYAEAFSDDAELIGEPIFIDPSLVTPEKRWFIVQHAGLAKKWLAKLHEDSLNAAIDGTPDPGSKAVLGQKGNRKYGDEDKAAEILFDAIGMEAYSPLSLIGITAAEKQLKPNTRKDGHPEAWEDLQEILTQTDGRPILVPEDDPRDEVTPLADEFDDL